MPNICLQFGQCGGQLGFEIFDCLSKDSVPTKIFSRKYIDNHVENDWFSRYENDRLEARSVIVDTEVKVISELESKIKGRLWNYPKENAVTTNTGGSGNNWARGHYENGPIVRDEVLEKIRIEAEKCDRLDSFFLLMSSAGGTGSGVGTYISRCLKNDYPKNNNITALVLPNTSGEVTVQNYNTMFTVGKLYESSDSIIVFSNDYLYKICSQLLQIKQVNYENMNNIIAGQLSCIFSAAVPSNCLSKFLPMMTAHPDYKLLHMKSTPYYPESSQIFETPLKWDAILRHMKMMLVKADDCLWDTKPTWQFNSSSKQRAYVYNKCIANLVACTGNEITGAGHCMESLFGSDELYVPWVPKRDRCFSLQNNRVIQGKEKFCSLLCNNGMYIGKLGEMIEKAWNSFIHQAYTHHFYKHGSNAEDFVYTFAKLESVIKSYTSI
ncbi:tubulin delta chain-like [Cimex lectularius]|uniref:Tubulin/FtsZ GTPase domain-containing protein n=1 Tax=Cimex lectularius TaxID=79782 RepID=A0A8I6SH15_CIMLE|nr:tubulin delta chain-like [Cimex lectularius]